MSEFERKYGKYAVPNLTLLLILGYAIGYMMQIVNAEFIQYLTLDPFKILHGQIWRIITWVLIPPEESNILFVLLMLFCCYSIGNALERTWGTFRYNVFIFGGILLTVIAAFVALGFAYATIGAQDFELYEQLGFVNWYAFGTYYINISIYMAFAMTYPNNQVLLMFMIPIRMKWLGIIDGFYMIYLILMGGSFTKFAVGAALLNCLLFYLVNIKRVQISPKQVKRQHDFKRAYEQGRSTSSYNDNPTMKSKGVITRHKCAVCGATELSNPNAEFRFCSKCNGNYEYCQEHLFTHTHVK